MKKRVFVLVLACLSLGTVRAASPLQTDKEAGRIEGEIGGGVAFGSGKSGFDRNDPGATFHAELRYNLRRLSLDVGVQAGGTIFHRTAHRAGELKFRSWNILAVSDYNFRRCRKVSLFAGIGLGYAFLDNSAPIRFDDTQTNWGGFSTGTKTGSLCFMPRIGIEYWQRLRLTGAYCLEERANSHFSLTLGIVLGGGCR